MKNLKKLTRFFRILLFAFMLAVCVVLGVAPIMPKRKDQFGIEIKMEKLNKDQDAATVMLFKNEKR